MKTFATIILLLITSSLANAQYYDSNTPARPKYMDETELEVALKKSIKMQKTGAVLSVTGTIFSIGGMLILSGSNEDIQSIGSALVISGGVCTLIGLPLFMFSSIKSTTLQLSIAENDPISLGKKPIPMMRINFRF